MWNQICMLLCILISVCFSVRLELSLEYLISLIEHDKYPLEELIMNELKKNDVKYPIKLFTDTLYIQTTNQSNQLEISMMGVMQIEQFTHNFVWTVFYTQEKTEDYSYYRYRMKPTTVIDLRESVNDKIKELDILKNILIGFTERALPNPIIPYFDSFSSIHKILKYNLWILGQQVGNYSIERQKVIMDISPMDLGYGKQESEYKYEKVEAQCQEQDFKLYLDKDIIEKTLQYRPGERTVFRLRPAWAENSAVLGSILKQLKYGLIKDLFPENGIKADDDTDIYFNTNQINQLDRDYVKNGMNFYRVMKNQLAILTTFSFKILGSNKDSNGQPKYFVYRSGQMSLQVFASFVQKNNKKIKLKMSAEIRDAKLYDDKDQLTESDKDYFIDKFNQMFGEPIDFTIDMKKIYGLAECIGLSKDTMALYMENDMIVLQGKKIIHKIDPCDIIENIGKDINLWQSSFQFLMKHYEDQQKKMITKSMKKQKKDEKYNDKKNKQENDNQGNLKDEF